jgi:HAE1 family hydrophobic/amphiphilic exporter-1
MNLSAPFILRPIMTTLMALTVLCLGVWGFFKLPVSNLPDVDYPTITVTVEYPGTSPETMANSVAQPLETEFMTIPGITSVTSSNTLGRTSIVLEFSADKSMDSAAQDVEAALTRAAGRLPPNLPRPPSYRKVNPSDSPIMYLALTSDTLTLGELYTYASTFIGQRLSTINGVAQVLTFGAPYAVRIQVDPGLLAAKSISLQDVADAVMRASPNLPLGQLDGSSSSLILSANGQLKNAKEFSPVIIKYQGVAAVRVSDVGAAIDSVNNVRTQSRYIDANRNQLTVVLAIQRQPGANTVAVSQAVQDYLPILKEQLPASVSMHVVYDLSESIRNSIHEVEITLLIALLLVSAVIFLYLGTLRDTLIPSIAMPMSILATFWFMHHLGYSLDNLSLLGLTLSTGFIVDDAIVVLENIVRRVEGGEDRWTASLEGSKQISFTILSMTLSLAAVFIPMLFMSGLIGKILKEFAVTVAIVILASGVISLTLTPMLCSRFVKEHVHLTGMKALSQAFNQFLLGLYRRSLTWVLDHRRLALLVGALSVLFSLLLFNYLPKDFLPEDDTGFFIGYSQAAEGTSPEKMLELQNKINEVVRSDPNVQSFVSIAGNPQVRQGIFFVHLKPINERKPILQVIQDLYPKFYDIPGVQVFLKNIPLINLAVGVQVRGAYQYTLQSLDTEDLYAAAQKMIERMQDLPYLQAVSSDLEITTPQLDVEILRNEAFRLGITAEAIERTLGYAYSGNRVTTIQTPYAEYDVILELKPPYQQNAEALNLLYMRSAFPNTIPSPIMVPLNTLSRWKEGIGPSSVNHFLQFPSVTIFFNLAPNVALGTALAEVERIAQEILPANVIGSVQGAAQKFQETTANFTLLILIAIFAIYIVLGILYESFIHPLTILSSLPPAILGGLMTLWLFGLPLSLYGYLGLILLIGIVKKNGIIMIDYAIENQREKGDTPEQAIFEACLVRFRPIMMTTFAAIMGAIPVAIGFGSGGQARQPLGLVIVGGLLLSQLITLYLTPVIYLYLEKWNKQLTPERA